MKQLNEKPAKRVIALTGGIGTGKSFVAKILQQKGIEVFDCDRSAKKLMRENEEVKQKIVDLVGKEAYQNDVLNKALLAKFLLASPQNATDLNEIVHPAVAKDFENSGLEWIESAILYDSAFDKRIDIDFVVCVSAPLETRISRIMQRDNITREAALQWITKQLNQDEVIAKADFELVNDGIKDVEILVKFCFRSFFIVKRTLFALFFFTYTFQYFPQWNIVCIGIHCNVREACYSISCKDRKALMLVV